MVKVRRNIFIITCVKKRIPSSSGSTYEVLRTLFPQTEGIVLWTDGFAAADGLEAGWRALLWYGCSDERLSSWYRSHDVPWQSGGEMVPFD